MNSIILFQPQNGFYDLIRRDIPLGLLSIARYLHQDYDIIIIDQRFSGWKEKLISELRRNPICVGITSVTGKQISFGLSASRLVKQTSDVPVVWGGVHPTSAPRQTLEDRNVDVVIQGEGEIAFYELVKALEAHRELSNIRGIWYKENGEIKNISQGPPLNLNELPPLPYHLVNRDNYEKYSRLALGGNVFPLEVGRGCLFRCIYCHNSSSYKRRGWHFLSAEKIVEEVKRLRNFFKVDVIDLVDDCFSSNRQRIERLIDLLEKENLGNRWNCEARINDLREFDDKMLDRLAKVGLNEISIGVETGSPRIMKLIQKDVIIEDVIKVNKKLSKYSFRPQFNFMCGYVTETERELRMSTELVLRLLKDNPKANIQCFVLVTPYPATKYYDMAVENGLRPPENLGEWACFNPDDWITYVPWLSKRKKRLLECLYVSSLFIDSKADLNVTQNLFFGKIIRLFSKFYPYLGRYRFRNHSTKLAVEILLFNMLKLRYK